MRVIGWFVILVVCFAVSNNALGQESVDDPVIDKDLWFVWLDGTVLDGGVQKPIVSSSTIEVYCCVRARGYRRFSRKIEKYVQKNYNKTFLLGGQLKKLNDPTLAKALLSKAQKKPKAVVVDLPFSCYK